MIRRAGTRNQHRSPHTAKTFQRNPRNPRHSRRRPRLRPVLKHWSESLPFYPMLRHSSLEVQLLLVVLRVHLRRMATLPSHRWGRAPNARIDISNHRRMAGIIRRSASSMSGTQVKHGTAAARTWLMIPPANGLTSNWRGEAGATWARTDRVRSLQL